MSRNILRLHNSVFFQRLIKYSFLRLINHSSIYGSIFTFLELLRHDPDEIVMSLTRSFQTGNLSSQLQYQPATAQLALLYHRLSRYRTETIELRQASGYKLTRHFPNDAWWPGCQTKNIHFGFSQFVFLILFRRDSA